MKLVNALLALTAFEALTSALVIPDFKNVHEKRRGCRKDVEAPRNEGFKDLRFTFKKGFEFGPASSRNSAYYRKQESANNKDNFKEADDSTTSDNCNCPNCSQGSDDCRYDEKSQNDKPYKIRDCSKNRKGSKNRKCHKNNKCSENDEYCNSKFRDMDTSDNNSYHKKHNNSKKHSKNGNPSTHNNHHKKAHRTKCNRKNANLAVLAPLLSPDRFNPTDIDKIIPSRYIIVFKKGISRQEINFHRETVVEAQLQDLARLPIDDPFILTNKLDLKTIKENSTWDISMFYIDSSFTGYSGLFSDTVIDLIRLSPLIDFVEKDSIVKANEPDTQNNAPWGLARTSHRERLNLGNFNKYLYDDRGGLGVTTYVIDTGININHIDFHGRARWGKTIPENDLDIDGNGHGSHCAGTIGSMHYGIAKKAEIVAVKVLRTNGQGTTSDVIKGIEFVVDSHNQAVTDGKPDFKGSVANMSLGGGKSIALESAVNAAVNSGIHFAVAAGNENTDACTTSPAGSKEALTVGASTIYDTRASFSNYGQCVDVFGPGLDILSTYIGSDDAVATLSGTSMAAPHVAGLLAYFLSLQPGCNSQFSTKHVSPVQLKKKLISYCTEDALFTLPAQTPNLVIYNGGGKDLQDFWKYSECKSTVFSNEHASFPQNEVIDMKELADGFSSTSDRIFDQVRNIFDRLNIF